MGSEGWTGVGWISRSFCSSPTTGEEQERRLKQPGFTVLLICYSVRLYCYSRQAARLINTDHAARRTEVSSALVERHFFLCVFVCVCVSLTVGAQWYSVVGRRIHEEDWDLSQNLLRHGEHSEAK